MFRVNQTKCIGCGDCVSLCPNGLRLKESGKAEILIKANWKNVVEKISALLEPLKKKKRVCRPVVFVLSNSVLDKAITSPNLTQRTKKQVSKKLMGFAKRK